ncbi:hypothetical protein LMG29542_08222 [Paraburkholderia humisilvae]|uniref:Uncharacterized protein n=1 Tax=Paraburkholderia humisilvae TaxID=627669 RepID=A0A6J5F7H3_9BURK|nr:hypothetical protein LMG29542_08222 [Paraburkholderia humisilvae]
MRRETTRAQPKDARALKRTQCVLADIVLARAADNVSLPRQLPHDYCSSPLANRSG